MKKFLMVPVQIDALYVEGDELSVVDQIADYAALPFIDKKTGEEVNSGTANLSEAILASPFQNKTLRLGYGFHLHWALPDALTNGDSNLVFSEVPNRWLVIRRRHDKVEKLWVVESDYLYPPGIAKNGTSVNIPFSGEAVGDEPGQPFRFMGRKMPASAWQESYDKANYYPRLTAIGYGEPTFAAFYPNCFSVFGFHDKDPGIDFDELRYEVCGWYDDPDNDELAKFIEQYSGSDDLNTAIEKKFNWQIPKGAESPDLLLCYGGVDITTTNPGENPRKDPKVTVTVADTPTEALSACLADKLASTDSDGEKNEKELRRIEDQLEALQMAFRMDEQKLDTLPRFREMRHENGFSSVTAGHVWVLRKEVPPTASDGAMEKNAEVKLSDLPLEIAGRLNEVNKLQGAYDKARHEIDTMRTQLFADWYKYMISVYPPDLSVHDYPPPDLVKHYLEKKSTSRMFRKITATGQLGDVEKDELDNIIRVGTSPDTHPESLAGRLSARLNELITAIEKAEDEINSIRGSMVNFFIEQTPAPRYWEPNEPVVLIEGKAVEPTPRHGQDGLLECAVFDALGPTVFKGRNDFTRISLAIEDQLINPKDPGLKKWTYQPWNPILLEWQVQFVPIPGESNQFRHSGAYSKDFVTWNYQASVTSPDLVLKPGKGWGGKKHASYYSGTSIITPQAQELLKKGIETNLIERLKKVEKPEEIAGMDISNESLPVQTMVKAWRKLGEMNSLSQTLDGFNDALLMLNNTLELNVDDPLAFPEYEAFTRETVRKALDDEIEHAPDPVSFFNPIRSGHLKLRKLRVIDTFGQTFDLKTERIDTTYKMTLPPKITKEGDMKLNRSQDLVLLPPRLAQPARLNFRWLSAAEGDQETNSHQATTPICGWLLPNKADRSLFVYDTSGKALGYFKAGAWQQAVDSDHPVIISNIPNPHLRRVVEWIQQSMEEVEAIRESGKDIFDDFIDDFTGTLNDALENIQPEKNMGLDSPALLIGRPIAVVRAVLNLELKGLPAINQDWNVFRQDMASNRRTSDGFTRVEFPVRLGEYGQLNDGMVGYWLEEQKPGGEIVFEGEKDAKFFSPQSEFVDTDNIDTLFDGKPINFHQSIADAPQTITLLMDVQGTIHATVGILPNKEIRIPESQYAEAIRNIEISFLHAPIITSINKINLPLSNIRDHSWSWVEKKDGGSWVELFPENRIERGVFISKWEEYVGDGRGISLWETLLNSPKDEGVQWLAVVDDDEDGQADEGRAKILNTDERGKQQFGEEFKEMEQMVETIFDRYSVGIDPALTEWAFSGPMEIREGWLKLRKA